MATSRGKFVGIDVAKEKLDMAVMGEKEASLITNDGTGIARLIKKMKKLEPELIVVEATGSYQRAVVDGLFRAGLAVAIVNPARVRQFARACEFAGQNRQTGCPDPGGLWGTCETEAV